MDPIRIPKLIVAILFTCEQLVKPNGITFSSQVKGQLFFHGQRFLLIHWIYIDLIIEAGAQVTAILHDECRRNIISPLTDVPGHMLLKPFFGCLAGHAYIQAFDYADKLGVGIAESGVFGKHAF